jgi:RNA polymerase sigma-70 factor (ECF subfamily)
MPATRINVHIPEPCKRQNRHATIDFVTIPSRFAAIFRASSPGPMALADDDALETSLSAYVDEALSVWPDFGVDATDLVRYVAARTPRGDLPAVAHAGDLLLACACARGVPRAVEAFHQRYDAVIARVLSRRKASTDVADDAAQGLYERLLVARSGVAPKIAEYKGTGPLRTWVSTAAATTLAMMQRAAGRRREQQQDSFIAAALATDRNPELLYMKHRYRAETEDAIDRALARLSDRERTLLRLSLSERMTIDQLGVMYRVNRATAARWLASARASVVDGVRDELRARLRLSESECVSILALVGSQLNISLARRFS